VIRVAFVIVRYSNIVPASTISTKRYCKPSGGIFQVLYKPYVPCVFTIQLPLEPPRPYYGWLTDTMHCRRYLYSCRKTVGIGIYGLYDCYCPVLGQLHCIDQPQSVNALHTLCGRRRYVIELSVCLSADSNNFLKWITRKVDWLRRVCQVKCSAELLEQII